MNEKPWHIVVNTLIYSFTYTGNQLNAFLSNNVNSTLFDHCDIDDPNLTPVPNTYGSFNDDPMFATSYQDGYHVHGQTPISPCIDAGNNNVSPVTNYDLDIKDKVDNGDGDPLDEIDIGAYENEGGSDPTIAPPLNIVENNKTNINFFVYPNPASHTIYIKNVSLTGGHCHVIITDMANKTMVNKYISKSGIDISSFHKGMYFIRISDLNNNVFKTFVKL